VKRDRVCWHARHWITSGVTRWRDGSLPLADPGDVGRLPVIDTQGW
jgi:hypothetical protein